MKKIKILVTLLFLCGYAFSQNGIYAPLYPNNYGEHQKRLKADSAQHIPEKDSLRLNSNDSTAQVFFNTGDSSLYLYTLITGYIKISLGGTPTTPSLQDILGGNNRLYSNSSIRTIGNNFKISSGDDSNYVGKEIEMFFDISSGTWGVYNQDSGGTNYTQLSVLYNGIFIESNTLGNHFLPISVNNIYSDSSGNISLGIQDVLNNNSRLYSNSAIRLLNHNFLISVGDDSLYVGSELEFFVNYSGGNVNGGIYAQNAGGSLYSGLQVYYDKIQVFNETIGNKYLPISVNGIYANSSGNVVLTGGSEGLDDVLAIGQALTTDRTAVTGNHALNFNSTLGGNIPAFLVPAFSFNDTTSNWYGTTVKITNSATIFGTALEVQGISANSYGIKARGGYSGGYFSGDHSSVWAESFQYGVPLELESHDSNSYYLDKPRYMTTITRTLYNVATGVSPLPQAGFGSQIEFNLAVNGDNAPQPSNYYSSEWMNEVFGTLKSEFAIWGRTGGGGTVNLIKLLRIKGDGIINYGVNPPNYANNAAAITGGLSVGDTYRNGDALQVVH